MTYQNVSIVLSPTMQISHRVLNVLFLNPLPVWGVLSKVCGPLGSGSGERTLDQLRGVAEIKAEMMKQESLLGYLHAQRKLRSAQRREAEEREWKQSGGPRKVEVAEKESTSEDSQREVEWEEDSASSAKVEEAEADGAIDSDGTNNNVTTQEPEEKRPSEGMRPEEKRPSEEERPREACSVEDFLIRDSEQEALESQAAHVVAHQEELLSMNHDLMRKLQAEHTEIKRLREEIQEMQTLYGYRTYPYDSSESDGSESEGESDTEEDMLHWLHVVTKANRTLKEENRALTHRIQEERDAVVQMRVKLQGAQWKGVPQEAPITPVC
ncbi:RalA-binding protein 1 [Chionoecetes opilio]|uniref:RalA-binding protein 1 n=1 Tax=Chionoecetes opilio TaxID=41210 RepID=A0A8J4YK29_CHIOP|nr:RalA-binding protein 1 [Chionoecetes opilio]